MDFEKQYDNSGRVPQFPKMLEDWKLAAKPYRDTADCQLDLAYGDHENQKVDAFAINEKSKEPLVVFIHGGYWIMPGRKVYSHLASGLNHHGAGVLIPSYQLCPDVTISDIITDLRLLCAWAWRTYERKLVVTGHSAGGHLAAAMMATDWTQFDLPADLVIAGLGISGVYDLRPLIPTMRNDQLQLDDALARAASPITWPSPVSGRFEAWVGGDESDEFKRQADTITACWGGAGLGTASVQVPNKNHFTVIEDLQDSASNLTTTLLEMTRAK